MGRLIAILLAGVVVAGGWAQSVKVTSSSPITMPAAVDSNSPSFWASNQLNLFNSTHNGVILSSGVGQSTLKEAGAARMNMISGRPYWLESVWVDPAGPIYAWYHQEFAPCAAGNYLAEPRIGAVISYDGGKTFLDMGSVISSGEPNDCNAKNGYTAGGVGDFSVILDRQHKYFYFIYSSYAGELENEGICVARMPYASRAFPVGAVQKYYDGAWSEPGMGGRDWAIMRATALWQNADANSYWGPSIHWNTYLNEYVMLLNHSCCSPGYPQEGVYISYNGDPANPKGWSAPALLLHNEGWYPQVFGNAVNSGTDSNAGQTPRLYIDGKSSWQLTFDQ